MKQEKTQDVTGLYKYISILNRNKKLKFNSKYEIHYLRHLLGLRMIAREHKLDLPEIFTDPIWKKSGGDGNFVISSSCVGFTNSLGCCAAMCQNGYSMIYCFSDEGLVNSNKNDRNYFWRINFIL